MGTGNGPEGPRGLLPQGPHGARSVGGLGGRPPRPTRPILGWRRGAMATLADHRRRAEKTAQSLLERNRFAVGKTAISLVSPRPQQLAPSGRARLLLEPRRSAGLISGLTTGPPAGVGGGLGPFLAV